MQALVSAQWLHDHLKDDKIVIADCRFSLQDPEAGEKAYREDHIPGAFFD